MSRSRDDALISKLPAGLAPLRAAPLAARVHADLAPAERLVRVDGPDDLPLDSAVVSVPTVHHRARDVVDAMEGVSLWTATHGAAGRRPDLVVDARYPYSLSAWARERSIPVLRLIESARRPYECMREAWQQGADLVHVGRGRAREDPARLEEVIGIGLALDGGVEIPNSADDPLRIIWLDDDMDHLRAARRTLDRMHVEAWLDGAAGGVGPHPSWAGYPGNLPDVWILGAGQSERVLTRFNPASYRASAFVVEDHPSCEHLDLEALDCVRGIYDARDLFFGTDHECLARMQVVLGRALRVQRATNRARGR